MNRNIEEHIWIDKSLIAQQY